MNFITVGESVQVSSELVLSVVLLGQRLKCRTVQLGQLGTQRNVLEDRLDRVGF